VKGITEIAPRRHVGENLAVAIYEVRDADHRGARAFDELPRTAGEVLVGVQRDLTAIDRMRDHRRLLRVDGGGKQRHVMASNSA